MWTTLGICLDTLSLVTQLIQCISLLFLLRFFPWGQLEAIILRHIT